MSGDPSLNDSSQVGHKQSGEFASTRGGVSVAIRQQQLASFSRTNWSPGQHLVANAVESNVYNSTIAALIVLNVIHAVFETDMRAGGHVPQYVSLTGKCFIILYAVDLVLRVYVYRRVFLETPMYLLDGLIVVMDLIMLVLEVYLGSRLTVLALMRFMRMLRIIRVIRHLVAFRELYLLIMGFVSALRAIAFGTLMIVAVLVLWSMLAVDLLQDTNERLSNEGAYGGCMDCHQAFATVGNAMLMFTKTVIAGDSWGTLAVPLIEESWTAFLILIPAFVTLQLGLMNVVAAVIVDRQVQARLDDDKLQHQLREEELNKSYGKLKTIFASMDDDSSGNLTVQELTDSYHTNEEFKELLDMMEISEQDISLVFSILDTDETGDVSYDEFVRQLHYMGTANMRTEVCLIKHMAHTIKDILEKHHELLCKIPGNEGEGPLRASAARLSVGAFSAREDDSPKNADALIEEVLRGTGQTPTALEVTDGHTQDLTRALMPMAAGSLRAGQGWSVLTIDEHELLSSIDRQVQELTQKLQVKLADGGVAKDAFKVAQGATLERLNVSKDRKLPETPRRRSFGPCIQTQINLQAKGDTRERTMTPRQPAEAIVEGTEKTVGVAEDTKKPLASLPDAVQCPAESFHF